MHLRFTVLIILILTIGMTIGQAQVSTSSLAGTITDPSGAVVPRAEVVATNVETNFAKTSVTDAEGHYLIQFLPVGTYRVDAKAPGFKTFSQTGIIIDVARNARLDAVLQVGTAT